MSKPKSPLLIAFGIILLYALWFIVPYYLGLNIHNHAIKGIEGGISQWKNELIVSLFLIITISTLKWWHIIGFRKIEKGGLKFIWPIFIVACIILNMAWMMGDESLWFAGFKTPSIFFTLLIVMIGLGFVEEGIFRGFLFYGLKTLVSPFATLVLSATIFGLFHFVNILTYAPLIDTTYQVIHAGGMGFLYAALRLRLGAIWPLMLLHGFWDFSLLTLQTVQSHNSPITNVSSHFSLLWAVGMVLPALIYGSFVYWRWEKTTSAD